MSINYLPKENTPGINKIKPHYYKDMGAMGYWLEFPDNTPEGVIMGVKNTPGHSISIEWV